MSQDGLLFVTETPEDLFKQMPDSELVPVLLKARLLYGGEDKWTVEQEVAVRKMLPTYLQGIDPSMISPRMILVRKNKALPKVKAPKQLQQRFEKFVRDYKRNRERMGSDHLSDDYVEYVVNQSQEWREKALEHKNRCNWRCQLCGVGSSRLEVHHTTEGYRNLRREKPWHLLAVCADPCHPIADMLRSGWLFEHGNDLDGFFREDDIPE